MQIEELRWSLRQKDSEMTKNEALMAQKIDFLEMQVTEATEREAKLKKMHSQVISSLRQE